MLKSTYSLRYICELIKSTQIILASHDNVEKHAGLKKEIYEGFLEYLKTSKIVSMLAFFLEIVKITPLIR